MKTLKKGKVLVAQSGGPTAVINQSLVGVVLESRKFPQVDGVYGAVHGIDGFLGEDFIDLTRETTHNLELVAKTPSSALGSTRSKPTESDCLAMFEVLQKHDISYFFYIGGNDSAETLRIINATAETANYELRCIHIPKTIDNDLLGGNDHTPGFGSAARYVTQAFMGINLDNFALPGIYIGVVMGRDSGFLVASSCLAKKYADDGPHLIYLPERIFDPQCFLDDVRKVHELHGRCVIAISEGIRGQDGKPVISTLKEMQPDNSGNEQLSGTGALGDSLKELIETELNYDRVRADTFGYPQRSFPDCVSDRDAREAREVGEFAVQTAIWDDVDGSIIIRRPVLNYQVTYERVALEKVARDSRKMPNKFITRNGNQVTGAFHEYVRPLVGAALPEAHRLRAPRVQPCRGHISDRELIIH